MNTTYKLFRALLTSNTAFQSTLKGILKNNLGLSARDFSERANIPKHTFYKVLSGKRAPNLSTLRKIIKTIEDIERGSEEPFIAIIAPRALLDKITLRELTIDNTKIAVREYPASTMEDAVVSAVRAENDGGIGIVCGPIVNILIEKIVTIPISTMTPDEHNFVETAKVITQKAGLFNK